MTDTVCIRTATEADWPHIWPFWHEIVSAGDTYAYEPSTGYDQAQAMWLGQSPEETWVALLADHVVGSYHIGPNHAGPGAHIANVSYMVDASTRGHGVGRAMVEHSIGRATEAGYRGIQFNAVAATNVYAIKLYEALGFETIARVPGGFRHPQDGFVDLLIMFRSLSP